MHVAHAWQQNPLFAGAKANVCIRLRLESRVCPSAKCIKPTSARGIIIITGGRVLVRAAITQ